MSRLRLEEQHQLKIKETRNQFLHACLDVLLAYERQARRELVEVKKMTAAAPEIFQQAVAERRQHFDRMRAYQEIYASDDQELIARAQTLRDSLGQNLYVSKDPVVLHYPSIVEQWNRAWLLRMSLHALLNQVPANSNVVPITPKDKVA